MFYPVSHSIVIAQTVQFCQKLLAWLDLFDDIFLLDVITIAVQHLVVGGGGGQTDPRVLGATPILTPNK